MNYLIALLSISTIFASLYSVGDTVSLEHQLMPFEICYGDYADDVLSLSDFNGDLNGGDYKIIVLRSSFTW